MKAATSLLAALVAFSAMAELPPPAPEEKAKLETQAAEKQAMEEREKRALAAAQERIARRYRGEAPAVQEGVGKTDVPKSAKQPLGEPAKPHAGRKPKP